MQLAQSTLALRGQQMNLLDQYRQSQVANQQQRMADLMGYRGAELEQKERFTSAADALKQENLDLREKTADKGAQVEIPLDPANPFGPKIKGPLSDPEIKRRYDALGARPAATNAPAPTGFRLLHPDTWFGRGAKPTPATPSSPKVKTQEEYDALPSGSVYINDEGKRARKP